MFRIGTRRDILGFETTAGNVANRSDRIAAENNLAVLSGHCASLRSRLLLDDVNLLGEMVRDVSYRNAKGFFKF